MSESHRFKDHHREERIFFVRTVIAGVFVVLGLALLIARYYSLQVINHQDYATPSVRNRIHVPPIPPSRGLFSDRSGELLAGNRPIYILSLVPEQFAAAIVN